MEWHKSHIIIELKKKRYKPDILGKIAAIFGLLDLDFEIYWPLLE